MLQLSQKQGRVERALGFAAHPGRGRRGLVTMETKARSKHAAALLITVSLVLTAFSLPIVLQGDGKAYKDGMVSLGNQVLPGSGW